MGEVLTWIGVGVATLAVVLMYRSAARETQAEPERKERGERHHK